MILNFANDKSWMGDAYFLTTRKAVYPLTYTFIFCPFSAPSVWFDSWFIRDTPTMSPWKSVLVERVVRISTAVEHNRMPPRGLGLQYDERGLFRNKDCRASTCTFSLNCFVANPQTGNIIFRNYGCEVAIVKLQIRRQLMTSPEGRKE